MRVVCNTLWLPKKGNTDEEYEDAACPTEHVEKETDVFRCAVADGATEASFARSWAKLLVDGFVEQTDRSELKKRWAAGITQKELPWYAEQKAESGAYAALIGLVLRDGTNGGGTWEAEALGDCCMITVRDSQIMDKFPLVESEQFNSSPVLLSSNSDETAAEESVESMQTMSGTWQSGDIIYLMSDAIARWTYKRQEEHNDAPLWLKVMNAQKDMEDFAEIQRELLDAESRPLMRNDDITLMKIELF
jgi:hypothetical protein